MSRTVLEGTMNRTHYVRNGKKLRKNWNEMYARYIRYKFNNGATGVLILCKNKDNDKVRIKTN